MCIYGVIYYKKNLISDILSQPLNNLKLSFRKENFTNAIHNLKNDHLLTFSITFYPQAVFSTVKL